MGVNTGLPHRAEAFILAVFMAGSAAFTASFFLEAIEDPISLGFVALLAAIAEALAVRLHHEGKVSVAMVGTILAAIAFGLPGAAITASLSIVVGWVCFSERELPKLAFNFGQANVGAFCAASAAVAAGGTDLTTEPLLALALGMGCCLVVCLTSTTSVATIMTLTTGKPFLLVYRENFTWLLPHYAALGLVGGGLAVAYGYLDLAGVACLAVPLLLSRYSMKQVLDQTRENVLRLERSNQQLQGAYIEIRSMSEELTNAYTGTLESLVAALDVRDQETRGHSVRVATHSLDIARMLGIKDDQELATIYRGALMHDVGKIGVPDAILLKPAKLDEDEWEFMRRHPAMGYKILAQVPYLRPTAKIVLAHHERWDGDGYPRRLKAEGIPLGARIFAICDTYDAIISDRPYRQGQSPEAALTEILRCAGSQFDPGVVEAFEAAFPRWREEEAGAQPRPLYLPSWKRREEPQNRAAG